MKTIKVVAAVIKAVNKNGEDIILCCINSSPSSLVILNCVYKHTSSPTEIQSHRRGPWAAH